jgi:hypothetical protein
MRLGWRRQTLHAKFWWENVLICPLQIPVQDGKITLTSILREIGCKNMSWNVLAQDSVQWQAVVLMMLP